MAKITKTFAYGIGVLGTFCLIFAIGVAVCSGILANIVSDVVIKEEHASTMIFNISNIGLFRPYWLLTFFYLIPSILALMVGCTRRVFLTIAYALFNILSLLASSIGTILLALLYAVWNVAQTNINTTCKTVYNTAHSFPSCICNETVVHAVTFERKSCEDLYKIEGLLVAVLSLVVVHGILSFVASYVSCYSVCNRDQNAGENETLSSEPFGGPYGSIFGKHGQYDAL